MMEQDLENYEYYEPTQEDWNSDIYQAPAQQQQPPYGTPPPPPGYQQSPGYQQYPQIPPKKRGIEKKHKAMIVTVAVAVMLILVYALVFRPIGIQNADTQSSSNHDVSATLENKGLFDVKVSDLTYEISGNGLSSSKKGDVSDILTGDSSDMTVIKKGEKVDIYVDCPSLKGIVEASSVYMTLKIKWKGVQSSSSRISLDEYYSGYYG